MTFTDQSGPGTGTRHQYENVVPGRPTSHNEETCAYCVHRAAQAERVRRERMAEIEACFEVAGVGRSGSGAEDDDEDLETETDAYTETDMGTDMDVEEGTDAGMDIDADDNPADGWETTIEEGACNGVLDIAFTGLTEARHGDAWCHYMYYGRLRAWDGLIVLVGVPVSVGLLDTFWSHFSNSFTCVPFPNAHVHNVNTTFSICHSYSYPSYCNIQLTAVAYPTTSALPLLPSSSPAPCVWTRRAERR